MKPELRFPLQVGGTLCAVAGLAAYPMARYASGEVVTGALLGAALSTVNVLLGYLAVEYSFEKSYTVFLRTVFGGMGLRLLLMLGAMVALIVLGNVHAMALTVSLLGFYVIYLVLEIVFLQRKVMAKSQGS